jgi:hypothetical protein
MKTFVHNRQPDARPEQRQLLATQVIVNALPPCVSPPFAISVWLEPSTRYLPVGFVDSSGCPLTFTWLNASG